MPNGNKEQQRRVSNDNWTKIGLMLLSLLPNRREPFSRVQRGILAVFSGITPILAIFCLYFAWYALPRYSNQWEIAGTSVLVSAPLYLDVNEEEELSVAIKNKVNHVLRVSYHLENQGVPLIIDQDGSSIVFAGKVQDAEQIQRKIKILVPFDWGGGWANDTLNKTIGLTLQGSVESKAIDQGVDIPIYTAPTPWIRSLFGVFFSGLTGMLVWFGKEWWDATKNELGKPK